MSRFILSDHHLFHPGIYRFTDKTGERIRPWADAHAEADEMMIQAHNATVHPKDTVYFMGDAVIRRKGLPLLSRMNGRKILIRGNHDIFNLKDYLPYFEDIRGSHKIDSLILTHYPIHPSSIPHWCWANAHGHIHQNTVMKRRFGLSSPDLRYINMCVEVAGLTPKRVEDVLAQAQQQYHQRRSLIGKLKGY